MNQSKYELSPRLVIVHRPKSGWPKLKDETLKSRITAIKKGTTLEKLRGDTQVVAYREFYWRLGIDPTKQRPSAEALIRRLLGGKPFPRINPIVDLYNLVSAESGISIGGYDLYALRELSNEEEVRVVMRPAKEGEMFTGIGFNQPKPLKGGELVLDVEGYPFALYAYRDSHRTRIRPNPHACLFTLCDAPGLSPNLLDEAELLIKQLFQASDE